MLHESTTTTKTNMAPEDQLAKVALGSLAALVATEFALGVIL
jgi:hypothetical protein